MLAKAVDGSNKKDPNFPQGLYIHPSQNSISLVSSFDTLLLQTFGPEAQEQAIREYGIAGRVWEAAYAMIAFISSPLGLEFDPPFLAAKSTNAERHIILELGSGSGLIASVVSKVLNIQHDRMIATDLPEVCQLLESNLQTLLPDKQRGNQATKFSIVRVFPLPWGDDLAMGKLATTFFDSRSLDYNGSLTHIICSDLVYFPELLAPLLRSLIKLTSPPFNNNNTVVVYISYKIRSLVKETPFWSAFGLWFHFQPVLFKRRSEVEGDDWERFGQDSDDTTYLFVAARRHGSFKWKIPKADDELLGGVGAQNNNSRKGDDTFENLLLMSMG
ncbi:putative methyltransferase-domain-containing protein [Crepidotus variabilis]|uniref:Methyltransferase-domain-containing protein n=1 Tax=Crepidotus variabilis TaxID=179855 RepID=A0A9P6E9A8_9AGAR|nr:putative methyltransferase-domain-containing protein [Crepidotus variabilis]